jgi:hypothetical protein
MMLRELFQKDTVSGQKLETKGVCGRYSSAENLADGTWGRNLPCLGNTDGSFAPQISPSRGERVGK